MPSFSIASHMSTFGPRWSGPRRYPSLNNISMAESFSLKMVNTFPIPAALLSQACTKPSDPGSDFTGRPGTEGQESLQVHKAPLTGLTKTSKKILSVQKHPECSSLFIGNLGFVATEDSLVNLIAQQMKPLYDSKTLLEKEKWLRKVRMGTFEDSGKCKGSVQSSNRPIAKTQKVTPLPPWGTN